MDLTPAPAASAFLSLSQTEAFQSPFPCSLRDAVHIRLLVPFEGSPTLSLRSPSHRVAYERFPLLECDSPTTIIIDFMTILEKIKK